jgi:hypothetical protein
MTKQEILKFLELQMDSPAPKMVMFSDNEDLEEEEE